MIKPSISRRLLLKTLAALPVAGCDFGPRISWDTDPFVLGVASGSPAMDGFVLWTRLPGAPRGFEAFKSVPVNYEIAADEAMKRIVRKGQADALPEFGYSVHAEIAGLEPWRPYWYRFTSGSAQSRIGRAMTLPAPGSSTTQLKLGVASCSNYEQGFFAAYRHLADEAPDFVAFLGDYIYEYIDQKPGKVRQHSDGIECTTLTHYRNRYAQYRQDKDLQRLHAEVPALVTWDDHEVQNDYADEWSQTFDDPAMFLQRRAAGYQAFYEFMPLRAKCKPNRASMALYDRYAFGDLAEISMLDGRQYRSREACYGPPDRGKAHLVTDKGCPERLDPTRSILGMDQEAWLFDGLAKSKSRWNLLAQDVMMAQFRQTNDAGEIAFWTDDWNGYPASRQRLMQHLVDSKVQNPVVLTGDIHSFWANDLKLDFNDAKAAPIGTEFIGTSITSYGPPHDVFVEQLAKNGNTHVHFFDARVHGYMMVELSPESVLAHYRVVSDAKDVNASVSTLKRFGTENGKPGVEEA